MQVRAKKHLGQHFLTDKNIAEKIVAGLAPSDQLKNVIEVGPGMGILTDFLILDEGINLKVVDIDKESVAFLEKKYPNLAGKIISGDFLKLPLNTLFEDGQQISIIGNFPYNISSQILFHAIDYVEVVSEIVGMFQKEVAERIASDPGSKEYGILSVLIQAYYKVDYMFTVAPGVFNPPPKVKSGVIKAVRRTDDVFKGVDEKVFKSIVKMGFNQRRKTLRNALRPMLRPEIMNEPVFDLRAERLSVDDFVELTKLISNK
jgi:16S rRNA (adenine1518-N6/adenine1519-N6)-dimethyltransferase